MTRLSDRIICVLLVLGGVIVAGSLFLSGAEWASKGWPTTIDKINQLCLFLLTAVLWGAAGIFFERGWLQRETPRDPWGANEPPRGTAPRLSGYQPRSTGEHSKNPPRRP